MKETPEEKKARLAKEALEAANNAKATEVAKPIPLKTEEVTNLTKLSPAGNESEIEMESKKQYSSLAPGLQKSVEEQEAGGHPGSEVGGVTRGNLASELASAVQDITGKIKDKKMQNVESVLANKKFLASDPRVAALVNHPEFIKKFPDFWQKVSQKAGLKVRP